MPGTPQHTSLAAGRWQRFSLVEQLANVGSEVGRTARAYGRDRTSCERAFVRALELLDLTIQDPRWKGRRKELVRARELFCDAMHGGLVYNSSLSDMDRYFMPFAMAARLSR